jgi:hypothetical protein
MSDLLRWETVGLLATVPEVGRSLPQIWRVLRGGSAEGLSGAAALMTTATGAAWVAWCAADGLFAATLSSAVFTIGFAILAIVVAARGVMHRRDVAMSLAWIAVLLGATTWSWDALAAVLVVAVFVQNAPAVVAAARSDGAAGVSLWSAAMGATEGALWCAYGLALAADPLALYGAAQLAAQSAVGLIAWRRQSAPVAPVARLAVAGS